MATNLAIVIGISHYKSLGTLSACHGDVAAMKELLEATKKYSDIYVVEDSEADTLKSRLREAIRDISSMEELFFYFSGHGYQHESDFYLCASDFDSQRPNETGFSTDELHNLLRLANANLVVKVIDACNSGTLLVKTEAPIPAHAAQGFNNLIQISSCRENQNSLAGETSSVFTEEFRRAALRKVEGIVYYTDIVNSLRDTFLENDEQTPFFVFQVTGREVFVEDAHLLDELRCRVAATLVPPENDEQIQQQSAPAPRTLRALLENAERKVANPEVIQSFVNGLFDALIEKISADDFSDFFDLEVAEHSDFEEATTEAFIIRVLVRQKRFDEFVTASVKRERRRNPLSTMGTSLWLGMFGDDRNFQDVYDLQLNCGMERAQIKFTLTPKYHTLKKLVMVVSCAPSLYHCYVFEMGTQHHLIDFGEFGEEGGETVRHWYKLEWSGSSKAVVEKVIMELQQMVKEHLEQTEQRLRDEEA